MGSNSNAFPISFRMNVKAVQKVFDKQDVRASINTNTLVTAACPSVSVSEALEKGDAVLIGRGEQPASIKRVVGSGLVGLESEASVHDPGA